MRLRQFLDEKRMSPREFKKTAARQSSNAKVGFEFECIIPTSSSMHGGGDDTRSFERLDQIISFDELKEYFEIGGNTFRRLEREFDSWSDGVTSQWVDDNLEVDQDAVDEVGQKYAEKVAREEAKQLFLNDHAKKLITFWEFINSEYQSLYRYLEVHELEPRYGWESHTRNDSARVYTEPTSDSGK